MKNFKIIIPIIFLFVSYNLSAQTEIKNQINLLLDNWHHSAAVADEVTFFGSMTEDAHYLGTDESENWTRSEMEQWAKEIFKRESAWDFKKKTRNIYVYQDKKLAWFDETLDTWMGVCRGSGVVVLTDKGWKIKHYVLSVAVPNDRIDEYLKLLNP